MTPPVKTRFAPSPTGQLHLGNVRTALFSYLLARRHHGIFLLRFEDTDLERSAAELEPGMMEDLRWLGLQWQEGPEVGGEHAPYRQSERLPIYERLFAALERSDLVYPCFCSEERLAEMRRDQEAAGQPPRYDGTCARLSHAEAEVRIAAGERPTLRFRVPEDEEICFDDLVRGPQCFRTAEIGDFVVRRSDGTPAFFFSNVVDDALMGVTHVIRGEDHLSNTPRQLLILEALSLPAPRYAHAPLLVDREGKPLSKRRGSPTLQSLRERGYLPGAVLNYLARLGHHYENEAWMDLEELANAFSMEEMGRSPAQYAEEQLLHWQRETIHQLPDTALWRWIVEGAPETADLVAGEIRGPFVRAVRDNLLFPADALDLARRLFTDPPLMDDDARRVIDSTPAALFDAALAVQEEAREDAFSEFARAVGKRAGMKGKNLFMPLRAALTGMCHGPEMSRIWILMDADAVRRRLQAARQMSKES